MRKKLENISKERALIFDGAMGTNIQQLNLTPDDFQGKTGLNEILNLSRPDVIEKIHESFLKAGCDVIETNTFGANGVVFAEYGMENSVYDINRRAAELSKSIAADFSSSTEPKFVAGSIGPGTKLPSLRQISLAEIRVAYAPQIEGLIDGGVDLLILETNQDLLQLKTLLTLIYEIFHGKSVDLPVIAQVTMETSGRMLIGTDLQAVIVSLAHFPLFALGINCSTGPEPMYGYVKTLSRHWDGNISIMPNAGMPEVIEDRIAYDLEPKDFADHMRHFVEEFGVNIVGGCCGTNANHIKELVKAVKSITPQKRQVDKLHAAASLYSIASYKVEPGPLIIGERCNATGSKKFREFLLAEDLAGMVSVAQQQQKEGAHLLDISVAYPGIDETAIMEKIVEQLNSEISIPLMIDSTQPEAVEAALKNYAGKAIVNSVNLEDTNKLHRVLALCKKYGAAVVALTIDKQGMAQTAERKVEIAKELISVIHGEYGLDYEDIFIDTLTFTLASGSEETANAAMETLNAIRQIKQKFPHVNTLLGVSNISYGLKPNVRKKLNSIFLYHALEAGLDAAILHVGKIIPLYKIDEQERLLLEDLIFNRKTQHESPLERVLEFYQEKSQQSTAEVPADELTIEETIRQKIINGELQAIENDLQKCLEMHAAAEIINEILLPAMREVGDLFGSGQMQLPFVLKSAEVMKKSVDFLQPFLEKSDLPKQGTIVLATVAGDVHDIGKNLVDIILSNNGFNVINLGVKQPIESILEAAKRENADAIGMSGLLVSSTLVMKDNLQEMKKLGYQFPVILGGAALNEKFVAQDLQPIYGENVFYASDAFAGLNIMRNLQKSGKKSRPGGKRVKSRKPKASQTVTIHKIEPVSPPKPPFWGKKVEKNINLNEVLPFLNKKALFSSRWQLKNTPQNTEFAEEKLAQLLEFAQQKHLFELSYIYGYFKCYAEENSLYVFSQHNLTAPDIQFEFPRQKKGEGLCLADYFLPKGANRRDLAIFHIVTVGREASKMSANFFQNDEYQNYLFWHGFSVAMAEALAEFVHRKIRLELKLERENDFSMDEIIKSKYRGKRYSPGYPAWPNLSDQQKIFSLLEPSQIDVSLTDNFQLVPEQSTSAMIVHHPQARYFRV